MTSFALIRLVVPTAAVFMYIGAFATSAWVVVDKQKWGLWNTCYPKSNDSGTDENKQCDTISPGDSDLYFEVLRTMACFTLLSYLPILRTIDTKKDNRLNRGLIPCIVCLVPSVLTAGNLALLGFNFKDDSRWKDHDPKLSWCYWLALNAGCLCVLMIGIFYRLHKAEQDGLDAGPSSIWPSCALPTSAAAAAARRNRSGESDGTARCRQQMVGGAVDYVPAHPDDGRGYPMTVAATGYVPTHSDDGRRYMTVAATGYVPIHPDERGRYRTPTLFSRRQDECAMVEDDLPVFILPPSYPSLSPPPEYSFSAPSSLSYLPGYATPQPPHRPPGHSDRPFSDHAPPAYELAAGLSCPGSTEQQEAPPSYEEAVNMGR